MEAVEKCWLVAPRVIDPYMVDCVVGADREAHTVERQAFTEALRHSVDSQRDHPGRVRTHGHVARVGA